MFLDARVVLTDRLINNSIHRMKLNKLSLLSLLANQTMLSWGERLVVPLMHFILLNLLPLRLVSLSGSPVFSVTSGQFMLFDASNYMENQWHEQSARRAVKNMGMMKLIKSFGYKGELLLANRYLYCRMYKNFSEALNGFSKDLPASFNYNIPGLFLYIFLVSIAPVVIVSVLSAQLILFAISLIVLSRIMISFLAGQKAWLNILLHPIQLFCLITIMLISIKNYMVKPRKT
jgi:hypothetical protein